MISRLPQGFSARCLRFTNAVAAAHARLASGRRAPPLPGGRRTLWVASKGFRSFILLSRAFPDASWAHARRKFFVLADVEENARRKAAGKIEIPLSPIAIEVVRRMDALFMIERDINGQSPEERLAVRRVESRPLVDDLVTYMREQAARPSRGHDLVKAINYMLNRWPAFTLFLDDGRVCMSNNAAERGLRGVALGRKSWLFCGSDRGGQRAAAMYSLIVTCKSCTV